MTVTVKAKVTKCHECPYYEWHADNSESNHSGNVYCKKAKKDFAFDDKYPQKIPDWCPFR